MIAYDEGWEMIMDILKVSDDPGGKNKELRRGRLLFMAYEKFHKTHVM
jgi:hypothetical protein